MGAPRSHELTLEPEGPANGRVGHCAKGVAVGLEGLGCLVVGDGGVDPRDSVTTDASDSWDLFRR